jgi:hypothetical protein
MSFQNVESKGKLTLPSNQAKLAPPAHFTMFPVHPTWIHTNATSPSCSNPQPTISQ